MKALKFLFLSLLSIVGICAQAQQIEVTMKNGEIETFEAIDSVVYIPSYAQLLAVDLEANDTDLAKVADNSYSMTYHPDNHPYVGKVYDRDTGATLSEGTDYTVTNPSDYNAGKHQYVITLQGMYEGTITIDLTIEKAEGYFLYNGEKVDSSNLPIDGDLIRNGTLSMDVTPIGGGDVSYDWYALDRPFTSVNEGGLLLNKDKTIDLVFADLYWRIVVTSAETENYKAHVGYGMTSGPVLKTKKSFAFLGDEDVLFASVKDGKIELPKTNKPNDCNGTITYTSSDPNIASIQESTNKVYALLKGVGEVIITATITGSSDYDYEPNSDTITLKIGGERYFYGLSGKDIETNHIVDGKFVLPDDCAETTENKIHITATSFGEGTKNSWYVVVPKNSDIAIVETGDTDVTNWAKRDDVVYVDEFGIVYDVYMMVFPLAALQGGWMLDATIESDEDNDDGYIKYYYGLNDKHLEENHIVNGQFLLPDNCITTTRENSYVTSTRFGDGVYNSWYVVVPRNTDITIIETGDTDMTNISKRDDVAYVDENGVVHDVYMMVFPLAALQGGWNLKINVSAGDATPYWGFTSYFNSSVYSTNPERERLADRLKEGVLPANAFVAEMTKESDGSRSFTASAAEYVANPNNPLPCRCLWWAIPVDKEIIFISENGGPNFLKNLEYFKIKNSDVYDNEDNSDFILNYNGNDYKMYGTIPDSASVVTSTQIGYNLKITIK